VLERALGLADRQPHEQLVAREERGRHRPPAWQKRTFFQVVRKLPGGENVRERE
jgi:hypothetical protein